LETSRETPEGQPFESSFPEIELSFSDKASDGQGDQPGDNAYDELEDETPPTKSSGGDTPPPPNEPPAPPTPDEPDEDPFRAWESNWRSIDPTRLASESTASLVGRQWVEIPKEADGEMLEVDNNDFVISNHEFMRADLEPGDYAIILRHDNTGTNGILRLNEDDFYLEGAATHQSYTEVLDEKLSSVENFDASTRAVVCAPLTPLPGVGEEYSEEELNEIIESNETTQYSAAAIGEILEQKFGQDNVSLFVQGNSQEIGIRETDGGITVGVHNEEAVDTHFLLNGESYLETGIAETPQQALMHADGINELLEMGKDQSPWLVTPDGRKAENEDRDFSVKFDVDDSDITDPRFILTFNNEGEPAAESRSMVVDNLMYISNLPAEPQTSIKDVDVPATLAHRFEFIGRMTGCDQILIPGAENRARAQELGGQPGPSLEELQRTYDQTAQKLGYIRTNEGNWLRDL
jgi:hypothetical protein